MSNRQSSSDQRRAEIEAWWALIARVLSFIFGVLIVAYDALLMVESVAEVRLGFLAAGTALMGPVVAASLAEIVRAARGGHE